ncbi:MAG: hypothetical protein HN742_39930 [Lentisphaerae bacterium]|jgi:L-arabinose isomerase|nr:hypothetical protein [Lentisphaerota bacterium]MBT4819721.1 hypothetical protein [Lentisphaerota bacterium]MBT5611328.1 hypothetical protein [Lentisphaerota bacterium]MBT7058146.1 hypothetical protein [Lentisphaerota bacterium]MBT7848106.1 hypothetical protein [Lentisphaerota bacterium]
MSSSTTHCKPTVGLLPLYLQLYDDRMPERRAMFDGFMRDIESGLSAQGMSVHSGDVCRKAHEVAAALDLFGQNGVDVIVTLHLAYSPSLESAPLLAASPLPVVLLDTTMDPGFGQGTEPDRIMYNHGIHGVMDLASVLRRRGKPFTVVAGHPESSSVLDRTAEAIRAAWAANLLKTTKALRVGPSFDGMGDFSVEEDVLRRVLGIDVTEVSPKALAEAVLSVTSAEAEDEMELDRARFACSICEDVHCRSVKVGLGLRKMLTEGAFTAVSANFLAFDSPVPPVNTVPFLELSKGMARGIGYGGEGDVLTAALVGALATAFTDVTFSEIFCPDWRGGSLFISHMGEINPTVAAEKPDLIEKPFPFTNALNPAVITCAPRPGPAVFVNLVPGPADTFSLVVAPMDVLGDTTNEEMRGAVRGWIKPACPVEDFLERYSQAGGTHHSALVLGERVDALTAFARHANLPVVVID